MNESACVDILLVEDNPQDLELILRALRKAKLDEHVEIARDGAEALAFVSGERRWSRRPSGLEPKLILLDLQLPKLNGLEVLEHVKRNPRTRQIPVVVLTSSEESSDVTESYRRGVNSYVVKPMNFDQFVAVITQVGQYWLTVNQPLPTECV